MWPPGRGKKHIQDINRKPIGRGLDSYANPKIGGHRHYKYAYSNRTMRFYRTEKDYIPNSEDKAFLEKLPQDKKRLVFQDHPHNEFIWLGYECGIQALICLGFIFYFMWGRFYRSMKEPETVGLTASLVCFAVICLTQFPMHLGRIGHLLPVLFGLFYVSTKEEE